MLNQLGLAAEFYQKVIDIDPGYTTAYYNLGLLARINKGIQQERRIFLKNNSAGSERS